MPTADTPPTCATSTSSGICCITSSFLPSTAAASPARPEVLLTAWRPRGLLRRREGGGPAIGAEAAAETSEPAKTATAALHKPSAARRSLALSREVPAERPAAECTARTAPRAASIAARRCRTSVAIAVSNEAASRARTHGNPATRRLEGKRLYYYYYYYYYDYHYYCSH